MSARKELGFLAARKRRKKGHHARREHDGVDVDGGAMAAVKAATITKLRKDVDASIEYTYPCRRRGMQIQGRNIAKRKDRWQHVLKKRVRGNHRTELRYDLDAEFKFMRCGMRSKKEQIRDFLPWLQVDG